MASKPKNSGGVAQAAVEAVELTPETQKHLAEQKAAKAAEEAAKVVVLPTWTYGSVAPEAVTSQLDFDRIVRVSPEFLSVRRGANVRDFSARENQEYVRELKESIMENGLKIPLDVLLADDEDETGAKRIEVYRGESRLLAILDIIREQGIAAFPTIPVRLVERESDTQTAADYIISNSGKSLTMLEKGEVISRLMAAGYTKPTEIGRLTGMSHTAVRDMKTAHDLPDELKKMVRDGWISAQKCVDYVHKSITGKTGEDKTTAYNEAVKKLLATARKNEKEARGAGKGTVTNIEGDEPEGEVSKRGAGASKHPDDVQFSKKTYQDLLAMHRKLLSEVLVPAKDYTKARQAIRNCLQGLGLPLISKADDAAAKAAAAVQEEADDLTEQAAV